MWVKLSKIFSYILKQKGISWISSLVVKALGWSGGFATWFVSLFVGKAADKVIEETESAARLGDRTNTDQDIREEYQKKIEEGASEEELIKSESDILNGGRR